ncbi:MAG: hypothetical protein AAGI23_09825 [Bacteroidota bacterium]
MDKSTAIKKGRSLSSSIGLLDSGEGHKLEKLAKEGLSICLPFRHDEEGKELTIDFYNYLMFMFNIVGDGAEGFKYLIQARQVVEEVGDESDRVKWLSFLEDILPFAAESSMLSNDELDALIQELKEDVDEPTRKMLKFSIVLLETYQKRERHQEIAELMDEIDPSSFKLNNISVGCKLCDQMQLVKTFSVIGNIDDAKSVMQEVAGASKYYCARSPHIGLVYLLDHFVEKEELEEATFYATMLAESIDYFWEGSIWMANPLFAYQAKTGDVENALVWLNRFGAQMKESTMMIQKIKFYRSAVTLMDELRAAGKSHIETLKFKVLVRKKEDGYPVAALSTYFGGLLAEAEKTWAQILSN